MHLKGLRENERGTPAAAIINDNCTLLCCLFRVLQNISQNNSDTGSLIFCKPIILCDLNLDVYTSNFGGSNVQKKNIDIWKNFSVFRVLKLYLKRRRIKFRN